MFNKAIDSLEQQALLNISKFQQNIQSDIDRTKRVSGAFFDPSLIPRIILSYTKIYQAISGVYETIENSFLQWQIDSANIPLLTNSAKSFNEITSDTINRTGSLESEINTNMMNSWLSLMNNISDSQNFQDIFTAQISAFSDMQKQSKQNMTNTASLMEQVSAGMKAWLENFIDEAGSAKAQTKN